MCPGEFIIPLFSQDTTGRNERFGHAKHFPDFWINCIKCSLLNCSNTNVKTTEKCLFHCFSPLHHVWSETYLPYLNKGLKLHPLHNYVVIYPRKACFLICQLRILTLGNHTCLCANTWNHIYLLMSFPSKYIYFFLYSEPKITRIHENVLVPLIKNLL